MKPSVWGPCSWKFIHIVTVSYPNNPTEEDKANYHKYFMALKNVLPCEKCKSNMSRHLELIPLSEDVLSNRTSLVQWGIDLHNMVNKKTHKPILSYDEALAEIDKMVNPQSHRNYHYILALLVLVAIVAYFWGKKLK